GAIYRVGVLFRRSYSLYDCPGLDPAAPDAGGAQPLPSEEGTSFWDYYESYANYNWEQRDDPCAESYYMAYDRRAGRNVLASDLGLIAKRDQEGGLSVFVTDLKTAQPLAGVQVTAYNFL